MATCHHCGSTSWTYKGMVMFPPGGPGHVPLPQGEYKCNKCGRIFYGEVLRDGALAAQRSPSPKSFSVNSGGEYEEYRGFMRGRFLGYVHTSGGAWVGGEEGHRRVDDNSFLGYSNVRYHTGGKFLGYVDSEGGVLLGGKDERRRVDDNTHFLGYGYEPYHNGGQFFGAYVDLSGGLWALGEQRQSFGRVHYTGGKFVAYVDSSGGIWKGGERVRSDHYEGGQLIGYVEKGDKLPKYLAGAVLLLFLNVWMASL